MEALLHEILSKSGDKNEKTFVRHMLESEGERFLTFLQTSFLAEVLKNGFKLLKTFKDIDVSILQYEKGDVAVIQVISREMPFLLDSVINELRMRNCDLYYTSQQTFNITKDKNGALVSIEPIMGGGEATSLLQILISDIYDNAFYESLKSKIITIIECVALAVRDWKPMRNNMLEAAKRVATLDNTLCKKHENCLEIETFLQWLTNNNFIFLGYYDISYSGKNAGIIKDSMLGIMQHSHYKDSLPPILSIEKLATLEVITICKYIRHSLIHRLVNLDAIIVTKYDPSTKKIIGSSVFIGLFTSSVYYQSIKTIPLVKHKAANILKYYGYPTDSFRAKELTTALEFLPREVLLQLPEQDLFEIVRDIVELTLKPDIKVFLREDVTGNFLGFIIFIPKDKFSMDIKRDIVNLMVKEYDAELSNSYVQIGEAALARVYLILQVKEKKEKKLPKIERIEQEIYKAVSQWPDQFFDELRLQHTHKIATKKYRSYLSTFSKEYMASVSPLEAVEDIANIEKLSAEKPLKFVITVKPEEEFSLLRVYSSKKYTLSVLMPILENAGFFMIEMEIYSFEKTNSEAQNNASYLSLLQVEPLYKDVQFNQVNCPLVEELLDGVLMGTIENDLFNSLVLSFAISWRKALIFRIFFHYMKQVHAAINEKFVVATLLKYKAVTKGLLALFEARFSLGEVDSSTQDDIYNEVVEAMQDISSLSEDNILRFMLDFIMAIKRTNYYKTTSDGQFLPYVSFKIKSEELPHIPLPKPFFEIFVYFYSEDLKLEGIHMRAGRVARGGLRLSDRKEDYRTEVLGLIKTQTPKNAIIVPVGAKGVLYITPNEISDLNMQQINISGYKYFLRGLLDVTDNVTEEKVLMPMMVKCHDHADSYLVVAADKGTATYSDYANEIASKEYNFWLQDAFASGGKYGYDHKKMAITARGAWISVRRHFEEIGIDPEKDEITVIGIGGMLGDVFGNGMLLSKTMKLIAAFDNKYIFIDPNPDPIQSYKERKRLFELGNVQWPDYNEKLISKGGGVFTRTQKSIALTEEMKAILLVQSNQLTPDELIKAILKAPADLFWNGGIGTYVKSSAESHDQVGDRSNDLVRVNGSELRVKVVGEGGNLGFTQKGRIEYARNGGRINTDSIDNSGGVDCSDHEVNIKIALSRTMSNGKLSFEERNKLLKDMEGVVAELVLEDNYKQTLIITLERVRNSSRLKEHAWLIAHLEENGELNRAMENLPKEQEIHILRSELKGLTRPEIAILLSYIKNSAYARLLKEGIKVDDLLEEALLNYFPEVMVAKFKKDILNHKLAMEIVATSLCNDIINKVGICYYHQLLEEITVPAKNLLQAFYFTKKALDVEKYWNLIDSAESVITFAEKIKLFRMLQVVLGHNTRWVATKFADLEEMNLKCCMNYQDKFSALLEVADSVIGNEVLNEEISQFSNETLKMYPWIADIIKRKLLLNAFDVIDIAEKTSFKEIDALQEYFILRKRLHIDWVLGLAFNNDPEEYLDKIAQRALIVRLYKLHADLVEKSLNMCKEKGRIVSPDGFECSDIEIGKHLSYKRFMKHLKAAAPCTVISTLSIVLSKLEAFT